MLAAETSMKSTELVIDEPKAVCVCRQCGVRQEIDDLVAQCPACAGSDIVIEKGRELLLKSIEIEEQ
jgi:Zn finger protein HypA/HybF involved in hydrogenase expression